MPEHPAPYSSPQTRRGGIFIMNASKRCEPNAHLFIRTVNFFVANGYTLKRDMASSELVLINTCCVTEDKIASSRAALEKVRKEAAGAQILLCGCMAELPLPDLDRSGLVCIGPANLDDLDRLFPGAYSVKGITAHRLGPAFYEPGQGLGYQDHFVMIAQGCANSCSYCNIRRVKGALRSESPETILGHVRKSRLLGATDVVLLADDCASWGRDAGGDLAALMEYLLAADEGFRLKLNYLFPRYLVDHLDRLEPIFASGRVSYVNIPLQSGSQRILDLMNRRYNAKKVTDALHRIRAVAPGTTFCTHLMVNFPTETEEDFQASLAQADHFDAVLFLHYSDNSGTPAALIQPKVPAHEARRRLDRASEQVNRRGPKSGAVISDFDCNMPYNLTGVLKES